MMDLEVKTLWNIEKTSYNLDEALKRQNLSKQGILEFREKVKTSQIIPQMLLDNVVGYEE